MVYGQGVVSCTRGTMIQKMMNPYAPQVDDPTPSFEDIPPPAYPKRNSTTKLQIIKLAATTTLVLMVLVGIFIILAVYIKNAPCQCQSQDYQDPLDKRSDPLIAQESKSMPLKLHLGEDIQSLMEKKKKKKARVDCVVERKAKLVATQPKMIESPLGNISSLLQMKAEETIISCHPYFGKKAKGDKGDRYRRAPLRGPCACECAC